MHVFGPSSFSEIERFLRRLGARNHTDNMRRLAGHARYFLAEFTEPEFMSFVFLQSDEVSAIAPRQADRTLASVAIRALQVQSRVLSSNWNLEQVLAATLERLDAPCRPLVVRRTIQSECRFGAWYIQDGSHTALGYAMALLTYRVRYKPVVAYCAASADGA
jgi:hypothetical protein